MKTVVLCLAVLGLSEAVPSGVYHQEYNYKTSAASYRNNELQHKTDDEGYYSKDGDLEGRVKPKVHANSEHSEYINPKLQDYNTGFYGGANGDTSSYGHLRAENTYGGVGSGGYSSGSAYGGQSEYGGQYQSEGVASSDHISGAYGSYGSSSQNSYGSVSSASANLRHITSRLEQQLQRELQDAIYRNSYYSQSDLENELRRNLSQRITEELATQFGQQSIRGGMSYTIAGGRVQPTPNYQQQDLESLKRQVEDHLLQTLRSEYQRKSSGSVSASQHNVYDRNYVHQTTTTYRPAPAYTNYPVSRGEIGQRPVDVDTRPVYHPDSQPIYHSGGSSNSQRYEQGSSSYQRVSNVRYTPVPNPESITTIASSVQHQLDAQLNRLLDDAQRQYFSQDTRYTLQSLDSILERLRSELRSNITYHLDEAIRRQYGNQIQRDGYMYTLGPNGQFSDVQNYRIADLEALRRQVETNLIEKLDRDFQSYRTRYQTQSNHQQSYVRQDNSHGYNEYTTVRAVPFHHGVSTPLYDQDYYQPGRPTSPSIVPVIGAGIKGGHYNNYIAGSSHGGYETASSVNIAELQRQLQTDLSRQLQAALTRQRYSAQAYTQSGHSLPSYDVAYQRLFDELNQNLTRQLEGYEAGGAYSQYGSTSRGLGEAQFASLRSQLQQSLAGQLQQGLRQTYSSSASYSASSSSSSSGSSGYRQARGSDYNAGLGAFGQYRSGGGYIVQNGGEDCLGDDPNASHDNYRAKRSYGSGSYGSASYGYRSRPLGLSTHAGAGSNYGASGSGSLGRNQPLAAQSEDDSSLTQQVEDPDFDQTADNNQDLTQQVEDPDFGQTPDNHQDLTQQVEEHGYQQTVDDNEDLTQRQEGHHDFGQLTVGHNQNLQLEGHGHGLGQTVDDNEDLTQRQEGHHDLGQLTVGHNQNLQQGGHGHGLGQTSDDNKDLTQQQEGHHDFGQVTVGHNQNLQREGHGLGQTADDNEDLTQQTEDQDLTQQLQETGQEFDDQDLTQQVEEAPAGKLQLGGQVQTDLGQHGDDNGGTGYFRRPKTTSRPFSGGQQVEDDVGIGHLEFGQQRPRTDSHPAQSLYGQKPVDESSDLTQKVETDDSQHPSQLNGHQELGYTDWLAKQSENENTGKLSLGSQVHLNTLQNQDGDLAQHVEQEDFGKLQSGSQVNSNKINDDQQVQIPTNDDDLVQEQLDNISEKLEGKIRKPNALFLETTQESSPTASEHSQNVQQVSTTSKPYVPLSVPDDSYTSTAFLNLQTPTQTKIRQKLEETVRKQLQQALNAEFDSGTVGKHSYQRLSVEVCNNISKQIEKNLLEDYTFNANFDKTELRKLQSQLEYELKKELKQNLDAYNIQHFGQTGNSDDTSDTQQQENVFPQPQTPQQPLTNPGLPSGNTRPNGYPGNPHPWHRDYIFRDNRHFHRRPLPRQNSFLDRERNQNNDYLAYTDFRPLNPSQTPLSGAQQKPYNSPETPLSGAQSKPFNSPETPLSGTQPKPWSDDLIQQQEEIPETPEEGLTQQQEDLGPKPPGLGQENFGSGGETPENDLVLPSLRPQQQNGYQGHHRDYYNHQRTWNAVPPKYVPYSERPNPGNSGQPLNSFRPTAEYQVPPNQYPQGGYQTPNTYPYQTQVQIGQPEYIPSAEQPRPVFQQPQTHIEQPGYVPAPGVMQPRPVFQAQFTRPNQIEDEQRPVSPSAEGYPPESGAQYPIVQPGYVPIQPRPVFQTPGLQPSQIDDEQKPVSFWDNPGSNVNPIQVPSTENQPLLTQNTPQTGFGFNNNGNLYTQQQTVSEAQQQQDRLLDQIRQQAQRRRYQHGSSSVLTQQSGSAQAGLELQTAQQLGLGGQEIESGVQLGQTPDSDDLTGQQQLIGGGLNLDVQNQNKFEEQLKEDLTKQLLVAIDEDWATVFPNGKYTKGGYRYIYQKLHRDIENNVTKVLTEANEPGQSEYSHLIPSQITDKPAYIKNLQTQLVQQLCKTLEKELDRKQSIQIKQEDENHNNQYTRHRYQHGRQNNLNQNQETAAELEPFEPQPQHASEVVPIQPVPPQSYNRNVGVKGHFRRPPATNTLQVDENPFVNGEGNQNNNLELGAEIENNGASTDVEQVELLSTTQQPLSWWQKFGNKVKSGASKLKEKIVGPASAE